MSNPNLYDLKSHHTHVTWYPTGKGGPIVQGGPPPGAPVLVYRDQSTDVTVWGENLTVSDATLAGTFVVALIKRTGLPGANISFAMLIPDVTVDGAEVQVHTIGVLSKSREVTQIGPGQRETYAELSLKGTAARVIMPL